MPDIAGKRIVVGGGTGDVGIEIVSALLDAGAEVLALVRSASRATALGEHDRLTLIDGFPECDDSVSALRTTLRKLGPINGAVASLGPWFHGPDLVELPKSEWDKMVTAALSSHFLFARSIMPALNETRGQYVMINGGGALVPVPNSGVVSILAHAQMMMADVLAAENQTVGLHTLMLKSLIVTRARPARDPSWVTAREVGEACVWLFTPQGRLTGGSVITLNQRLKGTTD